MLTGMPASRSSWLSWAGGMVNMTETPTLSRSVVCKMKFLTCDQMAARMGNAGRTDSTRSYFLPLATRRAFNVSASFSAFKPACTSNGWMGG